MWVGYILIVAMSENNPLRSYLAENPRMIGVLFTISMLLTQAGNVIAGNGGSVSGP